MIANEETGNIFAVPFRIIPGASILDKLPAWLTVPSGVIIGALAAYWSSAPDHSGGDLALLALVLALALWCGLTAPRGITAKAESPSQRKKP